MWRISRLGFFSSFCVSWFNAFWMFSVVCVCVLPVVCAICSGVCCRKRRCIRVLYFIGSFLKLERISAKAFK